MPYSHARWTALAALLLIVGACADAPLNPPLPPTGVSHSASSGRHLGQIPYPCAVLRKSIADGTWSTRNIFINYPQPELGAGRVVAYRFRGTTLAGEVVVAAYCTVPYTEGALRRLDRRFSVEHGGGADQYATREGGVTTQGCVTDGVCALDPIVVVAPPADPGDGDSGESGGGSGGGDGDGGGGGGGTGGSDPCAYSYTQLVPDDPNCQNPEYPTPEEEADALSCPQELVGKVITALIPVAGRNHEFSFTGSLGRGMTRVGAARSPATYEIAGPTASRDAWWIAERGTVKVNCNGYYSPSAFGYKLWIGRASYAGSSDLHMVMGPGHPAF